MLFPMKKKKYYPNNWKAIKNTPSEYFETDEPLLFEDFMDWKNEGWELMQDHYVIRETNTKTGKIKEHTFDDPKKAKKKMIKLMSKDRELIVADDYQITHLKPEWITDD